MKLKLLRSQLAALLVTTGLTAALTSGCGKSDQTTGQAATNAAAQQTATSEAPQGASNEAAKQAATAAAKSWLAEIDNGQYAQSWQDASAAFQNAVTEAKWDASMTAFRKPLGDLASRSLKSAQYATQLPGAPAGPYVVMQFNSSFANQKSAVETVTFSLESDGTWKASGYYVK